ncbi:site-specific integrase [Nonomuraea sp. NPDC055795]
MADLDIPADLIALKRHRLAVVRERLGGNKINAMRVWAAAALRPSPVMVWTPVQLGRFLDVAAEHRLYALFHLYAFRGPRRGEGCGVLRDDFDPEERTLHLSKQLVQVGYPFEEGDPKTDASDDVVALDTGTVAVLKEHRARQNAERLAWGEGWIDNGRMITHGDGSELHPAWVTALFTKLAYKAGLPPIRLHDLRHCAATPAYAAGADTKMVATMLRHTSTKLAEDTYTTVLLELGHKAAEASAALVPRTTQPGESQTPGPPERLCSLRSRGLKRPAAGQTVNQMVGHCEH